MIYHEDKAPDEWKFTAKTPGRFFFGKGVLGAGRTNKRWRRRCAECRTLETKGEAAPPLKCANSHWG